MKALRAVVAIILVVGIYLFLSNYVFKDEPTVIETPVPEEVVPETESGYSIETEEFLAKYNSLELGMSKDEIDSILTSSDGSKIDPNLAKSLNGVSYYYEDDRIEVVVSEANNNAVEINLMIRKDFDYFKNSKTKLLMMVVNGFVKRVEAGEKVSYDELVEAFGTEGISKRAGGHGSYLWVNSKGAVVHVDLGNNFNDGDISVRNISYTAKFN